MEKGIFPKESNIEPYPSNIKETTPQILYTLWNFSVWNSNRRPFIQRLYVQACLENHISTIADVLCLQELLSQYPKTSCCQQKKLCLPPPPQKMREANVVVDDGRGHLVFTTTNLLELRYLITVLQYLHYIWC
jgi:hypothetical protein